ncbi:MAG: TolC family outer membrane protein [Gammaproteobacteria bacterium]|nr:TolC family outer membrane protein [Gammaproteobacteria bacterium]
MKSVIKIKLLVVFIGFLSLPATAAAASLLEIYQQALQSDPQIHEAEARRLAALEARPQARGALLPQLSVGGDWTRSEFDGTSVEIDSDGALGSLTSASESDVTRWQFTLRQTLFRWDQIVGLRRADKIVAKAEAQREAAQQDLIVRVAQRYFDVLAAEDRLTSIHADRLAIARQLEQAKQRFEVGLIAITAVQESQAAYDNSVADEIAAKRSLATAREFLREITGEYVPALSAPGEDFPLIPPEPADEASWVDLSLSQNLTLVASRLDEQLARDEISFQRNGHYPSIELVANSGESDSDADRSFNNSPFIPADSDGNQDSVSVQFNLPLFAGGSTSSRVREAVYLHRAAREQLQRVTRETERQARDAFLGVNSERSRVKALEQAVASSQTALEATEAGFEVGTRTIVDVLNSQFSLYRAITNYYQSRYDYLLNALRLKQAAGNLAVQDLERIDRWLTERKTPEQVFEEEKADAAGS